MRAKSNTDAAATPRITPVLPNVLLLDEESVVTSALKTNIRQSYLIMVNTHSHIAESQR